MIDGGNLLSVTYAAGSNSNVLAGQSFLVGGATSLAWDGNNVWIVNAAGQLFVRPPGGKVTQVSTVGSGAGKMIYDGKYLWIAHTNSAILTRALLNGTAAPTFLHITVPGPAQIDALTFDGQYVWAVAPGGAVKVDSATGTVGVTYGISNLLAPTAALFDGYSIWIADGSEVARINAGTGARSGSYPASGAVALAYDGAQIWVAEKTLNSIVPIRACDGESVLSPLPMPAPGQSVAFDGTNIWVGSSSYMSLR